MAQYIVPSAIVPEMLRGDDNYEEWSSFVKNFLLSQDLWDVVEANTEPPKHGSHDEVEFKAWRKRNASALHAIQITCALYIRSRIKSADSAQNAWNILATCCGQEDNAGIVNIENEDDDYNPMLKYAHKGDWCSMERFLQDQPLAIDAKIGFWGETALHVAIKAEQVEIVTKLVDLMPVEALSIKENRYGSTALHFAACGGSTQMARYMIEKNPDLVRISDARSLLPLSSACMYNHREMAVYLYPKTPSEVLTQDKYGSRFLWSCVGSQMLDIALKALDDHPSLVAAKFDDGGNTLLWTLSRTPELVPSSGVGNAQRWIYKCIHIPAINSYGVQGQSPWQCMHGLFVRNFLKFSGMSKIYDLKMMHAYSFKLLDYVGRYLSTLDYKECEEVGIVTAFRNATKIGVIEIIIKLVNVYPQLLLVSIHETGEKRDLVDYSVINRQEKVFNLQYGFNEYYRRQKTGTAYAYGNNLFHLAGMLSPPSVLASIPGAALQMQREVQWYKEIERIVLPIDSFLMNDEYDTPAQVFTKNHKKLVKEGEEWMKGTATSYTVVAALIITIMFTAAFTVPGGNVQDIGIPVFLYKKAFQTFIISDAISLFASSTSVLMFLGILISRYAEQDFLKSLPTKLIIGLSTLFISIAAMMVSFCAALVITLNGKLEIIVPIILLACIPVTLFMILQFPLLVEIFVSTYGPGIFDRKTKRWY